MLLEFPFCEPSVLAAGAMLAGAQP